ncbi:sensor histidine kinase [Vallicoccus soli]|uniref:histidine kinase n=1 Tax=Vallicoccus soli TaxID=2339232 RepID=A0A3A3ZCP5_9ACTN|nr:GAF domain-containing protein [Vallicoccus soli]RJK92922.1 GAF domain-containing protein [Vallicoccus soli]
MTAAPLPADEAERLADLRAYDLLDQPLQEELDGVVRLARTVTGAQMAVVNLIDERRQWQACAVGMTAGEVPRDDAMCAYAILSREVLHVRDAREDPRFARNPFVTGLLAQVRMYASAPIVTGDGHALGTLCVVDPSAYELEPHQVQALADLAAQVMAVFALRRSQRLLERSNAELEAFAGSVAHDLKNPLAAATGYTELLRDELDEGSPAAGVAARLDASLQRANRLVEDLLAYARSGRRPVTGEDVDLGDAARDVVRALEPLLAQHGARVEVGDLPTVPGDPSQLARLVQALLTVAVVQTAPHRPPRVRLGAEARGQDWVLAVDDDGEPLTGAERARAVEPYLSGRGSGGGTGLGLATAARIARAHGGRVWAEASPLGGARICVALPRG